MVWLKQFKQSGKTLYKLHLIKILKIRFLDHHSITLHKRGKPEKKTYTMLFEKYQNTIKAIEPIFFT